MSVANMINAKRINGTDKLLKLTLNVGSEEK